MPERGLNRAGRSGTPINSIIGKPVISRTNRDLPRIVSSRVAPEPIEEIRGPTGPVFSSIERVKPYTKTATVIERGSAQDAGAFGTLARATVDRITGGIADTLNVKQENVEKVGLISLIGTGAGLLANGVKSLFDGTLKEKRAAKKAEKEEAKVQKEAAVLKAAFGQATGGQGIPAAGGASAASVMGGAKPMAGAQDFISKNWMWLALGALLLFGGGGLFKTRRAPRRRRAATKVVTRYRTRRPARRAPARRRRR